MLENVRKARVEKLHDGTWVDVGNDRFSIECEVNGGNLFCTINKRKVYAEKNVWERCINNPYKNNERLVLEDGEKVVWIGYLNNFYNDL
jgi:hypothetical protein